MQTANSYENRLVVLYDGLCGMCDEVVQFLLRQDKKDVFRFAPQQGEFAHQVLSRHGLDATAMQTICVIEDRGLPTERILTKSNATLRLAQELGGIWKTTLIARILPKPLRDAAYDCVARNRFRIFGRRTECRIVTPEQQHKFVESPR